MCKVLSIRVLIRVFGHVGRLKRIASGASGLYFSPNLIMLVILMVLWEGNVAHVGKLRGACRLLVGKPEVKQGRNKHMGWEGVN